MIVLVSGGFDPVHRGHLLLIQGARRYGRVFVALNSDDWLIRKKGYAFQPFHERLEILRALRDVHEVVSVDDSKGHVASAILQLKPVYFCNGGDRVHPQQDEETACKRVGCKMVFNIGGEKVQSSSQLVARAHDHSARTVSR